MDGLLPKLLDFGGEDSSGDLDRPASSRAILPRGSRNSATHFPLPRTVRPSPADRYIPSRSAMHQADSFQNLHMDPVKLPWEALLTQALFPLYSPKILLFSPPKKMELPISLSGADWHFPSSWKQVLDAPEVLPGFCTQNLDWGPLLAVNLGETTYLKNVETGAIQELSFGEDLLTSLKWSKDPEVIASGDENSAIWLTDVTAQCLIRCIKSMDQESVISMDWRSAHELTVGTRGKIRHFDTRAKASSVLAISTRSRICSLAWKKTTSQLAAGSTDRSVQVFDLRRVAFDNSVHAHSHRAAVRALHWMPGESRPLLLSGGGRGCQTFKAVDVEQHNVVCEADAKAPITSVAFVARSHFVAGFGSQADQNIQLWRFSTAASGLQALSGSRRQQGRILALAKEPGGSSIASLSKNETLVLWELDPPKELKQKPSPSGRSDSPLEGRGIR
jgi:WD40 repeat protein